MTIKNDLEGDISELAALVNSSDSVTISSVFYFWRLAYDFIDSFRHRRQKCQIAVIGVGLRFQVYFTGYIFENQG